MGVVVQGGNQGGGGGLQWRLLVVVAICLLFGAILSVLIIFWPGVALFFRWLLALMVFMGGSAAAILWQRRRWQNRQANTCIRCGSALVPDADRCQCGVASQTSFRLDVGCIIVALVLASAFLAGLIIYWWDIMIPSFLMGLAAFYLQRLNRRVIPNRRGIGSLIFAGLPGFAAIAGLFIPWFWRMLS